MASETWTDAAITEVLREADYLKTCPTGEPWAAIHMKARMEDLTDIVRQLRSGARGDEREGAS